MENNFSNMQRAEVLTQALPYIKRYNGKIVVVKYDLVAELQIQAVCPTGLIRHQILRIRPEPLPVLLSFLLWQPSGKFHRIRQELQQLVNFALVLAEDDTLFRLPVKLPQQCPDPRIILRPFKHRLGLHPLIRI